MEKILPLLAPLSLETPIKLSTEIPPWSIVKVNTHLDIPLVCVRSTRWPGAFAVCKKESKGVKFSNMYVGFGHKYPLQNHAPINNLSIQQEYSEKLVTMCDPTEEMFEKFKEPPPPEPEKKEEGEEGEKEEGEGEEDNEEEEDEGEEDAE